MTLSLRSGFLPVLVTNLGKYQTLNLGLIGFQDLPPLFIFTLEINSRPPYAKQELHSCAGHPAPQFSLLDIFLPLVSVTVLLKNRSLGF